MKKTMIQKLSKTFSSTLSKAWGAVWAWSTWGWRMVGLLAMTISATVFAQAAAAAAATPTVSFADAPPNSALTFAQQILTWAASKDYALVVVASVVGLTKAIQWAAKQWPATTSIGAKVHAIVDTSAANWIIPMIGSVGGALITSLSAGNPLSAELVLQAILIGLAAGGWGTSKAKADAAATAAAAAIDTKAAAVSNLTAGPKP